MRRKKLLTKLIADAIEKQYPLYWIEVNKELRLRAVTYSWENGTERAKTLAKFYLDDEIEYVQAFRLHVAVCKQITSPQLRPDIVYALKDAYWDYQIENPEKMLKDAEAEVM